MIWIIHHQINPERVIQRAGITGVLPQALFQAQDNAGQQGLQEQALVDRLRLAAEFVALIQAKAHQPRTAGVAVGIAAGNGAGGVE